MLFLTLHKLCGCSNGFQMVKASALHCVCRTYKSLCKMWLTFSCINMDIMLKFRFNRFEGFIIGDDHINGSPIQKVQDCDANPGSLSLFSSVHAQRYQSLSLCCHGNFLPFTFPIVTCVFCACPSQWVRVLMVFTMRHSQQGCKS